MVFGRELHRFLNLLNNDGMSPMTLAADLGHVKMFSHLLERSKTTLWTWGPVSCAVYPLVGLDLPPEPVFASHSMDRGILPSTLHSALDNILHKGAVLCGWPLCGCIRGNRPVSVAVSAYVRPC